MIASPNPAASIADEALDLLRASQERLNQMKALFNALKADVAHGKSNNVTNLSDLGAYLGYDWANYVDCCVADLQKKLDAMEEAQ
jgi:hypothetical protein